MFFKRRPPSAYPTPPWLIALVVLMLLFGLATGRHEGSPVRKEIQKTAERLHPKSVLQSDLYETRLFPRYVATLRVRDTKTGSGGVALCGQEASVVYEAFLDDTTPIGGRSVVDKPLVFRLGENKAMAALEQGVIGMQEGGRRSIIAPGSMVSGLPLPKDASVRLEMELVSLAPALPDLKATPYRIADLARGEGDGALCGQPVKVHIILWDLEGKKLFSTPDDAPLAFTPGTSQMFLGLEQGVIGMSKGAARVLIVPPDFQKTMHGNPPAAAFPFPARQTVLVDVTRVE